MISVIVPVHNEQDNIEPLLNELHAAVDTAPISEIIYVDDGSTDLTYAKLRELRDEMPLLRIIRHEVCTGQSAAFMTGARAAGNSLIVLMDGDGQNNPADIAALYDTYDKNRKAHKRLAVMGERKVRKDNILRRLSSRLANKIRSTILKDGIRDTGCSLKLIGRSDYVRLPYFNHMHRFLPALLRRDHVEIFTVGVSHRPRTRGTSKYGFWNRLWVGIFDLIGTKWLLCRGMPAQFSQKEIL